MLVKIVIIFLGVMVIMGMIGKVLFPGAMGRLTQRSVKPALCPKCGQHILGRGPCVCKG